MFSNFDESNILNMLCLSEQDKKTVYNNLLAKSALPSGQVVPARPELLPKGTTPQELLLDENLIEEKHLDNLVETHEEVDATLVSTTISTESGIENQCPATGDGKTRSLKSI